MNHEHFQAVRSRFNRYVARFRGPDGAFPAMQALKRRHTAHVVADAGRVLEYRERLVLARCDDPRVSRYFQRILLAYTGTPNPEAKVVHK